MSFNKARRCWCSVSEREGWGGGRSSNSWFVGFQSPSIIRRWWWSLSGRHWKKPPGFLRPVQNNNRPRGRFLTWSGGFTGTGSGGGRRCVRRVWLVLPGQLTSAAPAQQQVEPLRRSALTQPSAVSDSALWLAAADRGPAHLFSIYFFSWRPLLWRRKLRSSFMWKYFYSQKWVITYRREDLRSEANISTSVWKLYLNKSY